MRLLPKSEYKKIENILYNSENIDDINIQNSLAELNAFFENSLWHKYFLEKYYYSRYQYKNRFAKNSDFFKYICTELYIEEPTLYIVKREILYKAAMIFYKNGVL